jgi:hypothetical protein
MMVYIYVMVGCQLPRMIMKNYSVVGDFHFFKFELFFHLKNNKKKVILRNKLWEKK